MPINLRVKPESINTDLGKRAVVYDSPAHWLSTPMPGVERRYLERDGGESARRATTIVRYAPDSHYSPHTHHGGEEFLVLEGVFSDELGDYPAGTYVRNPCGSSHKPFSTHGCTIFVKLCQMDAHDQQRICVYPDQYAWSGDHDGIMIMPLHSYGQEQVRLERWQAQTTRPRHAHPGGEEILVMEGSLQDEHGYYPVGTWLRNPTDSEHTAYSEEGCLIYVKTGHLVKENND